jgi:hypothetical protein
MIMLAKRREATSPFYLTVRDSKHKKFPSILTF